MDEWTLDELALLRLRYGSWENVKLSAALDRDLDEIEAKASELALAKNKAAFVGTRRMPRWPAPDLERLRELYPTTPNLELARQFGRSVKSVTSKASTLRLRKGPEQLEHMGRANRALRRPQKSS